MMSCIYLLVVYVTCRIFRSLTRIEPILLQWKRRVLTIRLSVTLAYTFLNFEHMPFLSLSCILMLLSLRIQCAVIL